MKIKKIAPEHLQLYLIVTVLVLFGAYRIFHKAHTLGFPLLPESRVSVWQVETRVTFDAVGGPVTVSLSIPEDNERGYKVLDENMASSGYGFTINKDSGVRRAIWTKRNAEGTQTLYYRVNVYDAFGSEGFDLPEVAPPVPLMPLWGEPYEKTVTGLLAEARAKSSDRVSYVMRLLEDVYTDTPKEEINLLKHSSSRRFHNDDLTSALLNTSKIPNRIIQGVYLKDRQRYQPLRSLFEIYTDDGWIIIDPKTRQTGLPYGFLPLQRGGSLLDVEGGTHSNISVSVMKTERPILKVVSARADEYQSSAFDFSVHSLPVSTQKMFQLLSVLPVGILIVVLMRNVVGVNTSGTFMPVLIALAFVQTSLVPGLILFGIIIVVGLAIRFYLSRLNLLLVPRIAAAVIVVVGLMSALSIFSYHLGYDQGLTITFFPVIVLAWTIERASMAWEEEGANSALKQIFMSLLVAILAYALMINPYVEHLCYTFMEIHLILLAFVLLLGAYSGLRLTELWRFEPIVREDD
jgi:hypothetical protein